jgi:hypothetical protein
MFSDRTDYLMQMIERLVASLVDQVRKALGGDPQSLQELERQCEEAMDDEFGELHRRVQALSSRAAADAIRPVTRLRNYAAILGGRALLLHRRAHAETATAQDAALQAEVPAMARRALELLVEATLVDAPTDVERTLCPALFALVDPQSLQPRTLEALIALGSGSEAPE